ncbi:hypothetical protein OC842_008019, partial [Tilletia horrida]
PQQRAHPSSSSAHSHLWAHPRLVRRARRRCGSSVPPAQGLHRRDHQRPCQRAGRRRSIRADRSGCA